MAARIAYTQFKRRNNPPGLPLAHNAISTHQSKEESRIMHPEIEKNEPRVLEVERKSSSTSSSEQLLASQIWNEGNSVKEPKTSSLSSRMNSSQIAIFPQYIAQEPTVIMIREADLPKLSDSFTVTLPNDREIFQVKRERPSWSHRQHIIDPVSGTTVLTIRRDIGKLPVSYGFDDDAETKVLDLQGNFSAPLQGARATAFFTNVVDRSKIQLFMQGSWHNRHAFIKDVESGDTLATMRSGTLNARNLIGSRRTYEVSVSAGVDLAVMTGMIVALDARSS